jgi:LAS superfamily LD-carboxypeptidase LdcB
MRRLAKVTFFFTVFILVVFTLIVGNALVQNNFRETSQVTAECSSPCINVTPNPLATPLVPQLQSNDQQRFIAKLASKLTTIPSLNTYEYTLLRAYGAVFINPDQGVKLPAKVILANEQETQEFQSSLTILKVDGTRECYLQKSATEAFNRARSLQHIPLKSGFSGDCLRDFATNLKFWQKYANNQTLERVKKGQETKILGLVAPPGTSQHLWGLAIDLHVSNAAQRKALNQNGWFQTVENDIPHWTYLGLNEENLRQFGLRNKIVRGLSYWLTPL